MVAPIIQKINNDMTMWVKRSGSFVIVILMVFAISSIASASAPYIIASPSTGSSPLAVTFTTNVAGSSYYIDLGNGGVMWVGGGVNAGAAGACTPLPSGDCVWYTRYTYSANGTYVAKLMSGGVAISTVTIYVGSTSDFQAPSSPTNVAATPNSPTSMTVSWTPSTDNVGVTSYSIYRQCCKVPPPFPLPGPFVATVTAPSYTDLGVVGDNMYEYTVTASDASGNVSAQSAGSPVVSTPPYTLTPSFSVSASTGPAPLALTFYTNVAGSDYFINFGNGTGSWVGNGLNAGATAPCTQDGSGNCLYKTLYTYPINGIYTASLVTGTSTVVKTLSLNVGSTTNAQSPYPPYVAASPSTGPSPLAVTFTTNVAGSAYHLTFGDSAGASAWIGNGVNGDSAGACTPTANGDCVWYTAHTYQANGTYTASLINGTSTVIGTVNIYVGSTNDFQAPTVPTNVSAVAASPTSMNVTWSPSTDNVGVTSYNVYRQCCALPFPYPGPLVATVSSPSYSDLGVVGGNTYGYTITASDASANASAQSAPGVATTPPYALIPTLSALPSSGPSPLAVTFKTNVAGSMYAIDFGVGSSAWIGNGLNAGATTPCTPDGFGNCLYSTNYTYNTTSGTYTAKIMSGGVAVASVTILVGSSPPPTSDTTPPSTPTGFTATALSSSQISLVWSASTDNVGVTGYQVFRGGVQVGTPMTNSYPDTSLTASTAYSYTVKAKDAAGNVSGASATASATTLPATASFVSGDRILTTANLNVRATPSVTGTLLGTQASGALGTLVSGPTTADGYIWWNINYDTGADGWSVQDYLVKTTPLPTATLTASSTSITSGQSSTLSWTSTNATSCIGVGFSASGISGSVIVTPTVTTTYSITCTGDGGTSPSASVTVAVTAAADTTPPSTPTNLATSLVSKFEIDLTWSASTDSVGVAGYSVYRNSNKVGTASGTSYSDSGLNPGTSYGYTVSAFDAAGNVSARSQTLSATTLPSTYSIGTRIKTAVTLNVRRTSGTSGKILGTQLAGALGTIIGGPQKGNGYTWWNVNFDTGVDGWIVQDLSIMNTLSARPSGAFFSVIDILDRLEMQVKNILAKIEILRASLVAGAAAASQ